MSAAPVLSGTSDLAELTVGTIPVHILRALAVHPDLDARKFVVSHPSTPGDVLATLADDPDERQEVAEDPSMPTDVLRTLAVDPDESMRVAVASNSSTPADALRPLAADPDSYVRARVPGNPSTPVDVFRNLFAGEERGVGVDALFGGLHGSLAWNRSAPVDIFYDPRRRYPR